MCHPDNISCLCTDASFQTAAAACNAANCTMVEVLSATNSTRAACGIPIKDASATMIGVTAAFGGLAFVMVVMRLLHRGFSANAELGWDDFLIGLSGVGGTPYYPEICNAEFSRSVLVCGTKRSCFRG